MSQHYRFNTIAIDVGPAELSNRTSTLGSGRIPMRSRDSARALMVMAAIIWGSTFMVGRVIVRYVDPLGVTFIENVIGALILVSALLWKDRSSGPEGLRFFGHRMLVILGLLNGLAYAANYIALYYTTAINASLLVNFGMAMVPVFAFLFGRERVTHRNVMALVIGILGTVLVTTGGNLGAVVEGQLVGDLLALLAGLVWALWIVLAHDAMKEAEKPLRVAAPNAAYTAIVLGVAALVFSDPSGVQSASSMTWAGIIYLGVFSIGIAFLLYYEGLKHLGGTTSAVYLLLQSAVAVFLGFFFLGESLTVPLLIGAAMVMSAVAIAD